MREISGGIIFPSQEILSWQVGLYQVGFSPVDTKQNYRYKLDVFLEERYSDRFKGCTWCAPL